MRALLCKIAACVAVGTVGCTTAAEDDVLDEDDAGFRLARVHVTASARRDADEVALKARFAVVRGLDEPFARARIGMPVLVRRQLGMGRCELAATLHEGDADAEPKGSRELVLFDVGEIEVAFDHLDIAVNPRLVPDLLPYMSGVEYAYAESHVPGRMRDPQISRGVNVSLGGGVSTDAAPVVLHGELPAALELRASWTDTGMQVAWESGNTRDDVVLRIESQGEHASALWCRLADEGLAELPSAALAAAGLFPGGVTVSMSRFAESSFDLESFPGAEFVLERAESAEL